MNGTITVAALDSDEQYEIDTRPGAYGMYEGIVTGPLGTISGDAYGLQQLGLALLAASASADFATRLRVDQPGPLHPDEAPTPDLSEQSPAQAAAYEGWTNTALVWGSAGDDMLPVEPSDWTSDEDGTAIALVDDFTDLHFADGRLQARSRCRHDHIHTQHLKHPDDLAAVRREAEECPGDEDRT
ncbi:hypothetical protein PV516_19405 [Streptomyces scabiei]|uniref:hypothetical protein n=1 Tax=Streptomyces scabiei TaxID=1930 RepID=UPI0029B65F7F|nr:hypothetical protein [Streptomyces scabiei]MDX3165957.1 hypothetical protein [Streptomyces scabiei]